MSKLIVNAIIHTNVRYRDLDDVFVLTLNSFYKGERTVSVLTKFIDFNFEQGLKSPYLAMF